jgi:hypothetical protein
MSKHHKAAKWGGSEVTRMRAVWTARILTAYRAGRPIKCGRCGKDMIPGEPFDLGHRHALVEGGDRKDYHPEHRSENRADGARITNARRSRIRPW